MKTALTVFAFGLLTACSGVLPSSDAIGGGLSSHSAIPTQINCTPEPTLIYSKTGDLIDRVYPVLHPSCSAPATASRRASGLESTQKDTHVAVVRDNMAQSVTDQPIVGADVVQEVVAFPLPETNEPVGVVEVETPEEKTVETPVQTVVAEICSDPDSCHDHEDHDPLKHDSHAERVAYHGAHASE